MNQESRRNINGFVRLPRNILDELLFLDSEGTISHKEFKIILLFISESISYKVNQKGKVSKNGEMRKTCFLSYRDIEDRLHVKGNLSRNITKLKDLRIISSIPPQSNRDKILYTFEPDPSKWNIPVGVESLISGDSTGEGVPSPPPGLKNGSQVNFGSSDMGEKEERDNLLRQLEEI